MNSNQNVLRTALVMMTLIAGCSERAEPNSVPMMPYSVPQVKSPSVDEPSNFVVQTETTGIRPLDPTPNKKFGNAMAIDGDTVLVGAPGDVQQGIDSGAAYLFSPQNGHWQQVVRLAPSNIEAGDSFGFSTAISGDTALVGAYLAHQSAGAYGSVYVYERNASGWAFREEWTASVPESLALFGHSVAIDENVAVVGAMQAENHHGAAYVFEKSTNGGWSEKARLLANDGAFGDLLGIAVDVNGDTLVAGASSASCSAGKYCGAAYVFRRSAGVWKQVAKLVPQDIDTGNYFGRSVSVSGNMVLASSYAKKNADGSRGAVYVFEENGGVWSETTKVHQPNALDTGFGVYVDHFGSKIVVGSCYDNVNGAIAGSAAVYVRESGGWSQESQLVAGKGKDGDAFGCFLAASPSTIAVGANGADAPVPDSGVAYLFSPPPTYAIGHTCLFDQECVSGQCCGAAKNVTGTCCDSSLPTDGGGGASLCDAGTSSPDAGPFDPCQGFPTETGSCAIRLPERRSSWPALLACVAGLSLAWIRSSVRRHRR